MKDSIFQELDENVWNFCSQQVEMSEFLKKMSSANQSNMNGFDKNVGVIWVRGIETYHIVESALFSDMSKNWHTDDRIDESNEGEECTDVEQRWQTDDQCEEEFTNAFGSFDEP